MYLKTLKLVGFKSFADRTRLEFRPGISVVVGPNGSGKSNLVDAVHWVLGTQAPTSLRTNKMEDVIFAGTATRPALGRAEVTVIFDNSARDLVLDLDEVAITRRLFRDGTSEYEINGVGCRLLDVTDLLSDSGVGRHQHVIVNQGQVDTILAADNEEHRAIIEEAAGILKHKLRKERALRRLARTSDDMARVTDILNEVARQMRPLKRQAEAAHRHAEVRDEVHALTLFLGGQELRRLDRSLAEGRARQAELEAANRQRVIDLAAVEAVLENALRDLSRAESRLTSLHRQFEQARKRERDALERLEAVELRLASETELLGRSRRSTGEIGAELKRVEGRRKLLSSAIEERQSALGQLAEAIANLEGDESRRQQVMADLAERRRLLSGEREITRDKWQVAARSAAQAAERNSLLEARRQMISATLGANLGDSPAPMLSEDDLARIGTVEHLARRAIEVITDRVAQLRIRQSGYRSHLDASRPELDQALQRVGQLRLQSERDNAELGSLAVGLAESRVRREAVAESLLREIDADETKALAAPRPAIEGDLAERLSTRSAELRRMGPVNPMAAEEYASLAERHDFMSAQVDDLDHSAKELQKVMKALDEEIESRFVAAFTEVAAAYQEYFSVLFPGGHGRMRLLEPSTPLTSGVEIEAQPQGKKVSRLSLLSGGERSLAALAFLFAVFKARPSPFYILDEVEAALDDSNLRRFLRLVEVFRGESQVVLISHQQQTMEVADILYGVTLEPAGSSQVLSRAVQPATLGS